MIIFWKIVRFIIRWILVGSILLLLGFGIPALIITFAGGIAFGEGVVREIDDGINPKVRYNPWTGRREPKY